MTNSGLDWYGYLHVNGTIHVKRFFDYGDIHEAESSDFVVRVVGPFDAGSRDEAMEIVRKRLGG